MNVSDNNKLTDKPCYLCKVTLSIKIIIKRIFYLKFEFINFTILITIYIIIYFKFMDYKYNEINKNSYLFLDNFFQIT